MLEMQCESDSKTHVETLKEHFIESFLKSNNASQVN